MLALGLGACGSSTSSPSGSSSTPATTTTGGVEFAKTKFVLHLGLAFGAFHHWIYKPAKTGELTHPFLHKLATIKAALAALFVYHELKLALKDAQADPTLSKLVAPITALQNRFHGLSGQARSGAASAASVGGLDSLVSSVKQQSAALGHPIAEQVPATPSG